MIEVIRCEKVGGLSNVRFSDGTVLYTKFHDFAVHDAYFRYIYSHYDVDKIPTPDPTIWKDYSLHKLYADNLLRLNIKKEIKDKLLKKYPIKEGDVVVEVGAFQGFGTVRLAKKVGPKGRVIAIEPDEMNFAMLCKNIHENKIYNVTPINKGVYKEEGEQKLYKMGKHPQSLGLHKVTRKTYQLIKVDTIDNILRGIRPDYVILTINLGEYDAILGMNSSLSRGPRLFITGHNKTYS